MPLHKEGVSEHDNLCNASDTTRITIHIKKRTMRKKENAKNTRARTKRKISTF